MKRKIKFFIVYLIIMTILCLNNSTHAAINKLTLKTTTDNKNYNVGDTITVTVNWTEKMQAAGFVLKYDSEKLIFESADISPTYYDNEKLGKINVSWFSIEEVDYTEFKFIFKAKKEGNATISIENPDAFANGNLEMPKEYDVSTYGKKTVKINNKTNDSTNANSNIENNTEFDDPTMAEDNIPQTGITNILWLIPVISIIGIFEFVRYKKLSDI